MVTHFSGVLKLLLAVALSPGAASQDVEQGAALRLVNDFRSDDPGVRSQATIALRKEKRAVLSCLEAFSDDRNAEVRERVRAILSELKRTETECLEEVSFLIQSICAALNSEEAIEADELCDLLLAIDPSYSIAKTLKKSTQRARLSRETLKEAVSEVRELDVTKWKSHAIPMRDQFAIPTLADWEEVFKRLNARLGVVEVDMTHSQEALALNRKLDTFKFESSFPNGTFADVLTFVNATCGVTMILGSKAMSKLDLTETRPFDTSGLMLKAVLRKCLAAYGLVYQRRGGRVYITSGDR